MAAADDADTARSPATGRRTEAGDVVFYARRYERVLCDAAPHHCRQQRLSWIATILRMRRLSLFVLQRWAWVRRYPTLLPAAAIKHAVARDFHGACARCAPILVLFEVRRDALVRMASDHHHRHAQPPPSWRIAALRDRARLGYQAILCAACREKASSVASG